jgi:RNA polymerase nonessential primary-like sigma factor
MDPHPVGPRAEVLEGRFGLHDREPETLEVLSDRLGLTRERIRQIQNEAIAQAPAPHGAQRHFASDAVL